MKNLLDYRSQGLIIAELAASIVARVCENNDQREKFAEMGGVEPIINLLLTSYPKVLLFFYYFHKSEIEHHIYIFNIRQKKQRLMLLLHSLV